MSKLFAVALLLLGSTSFAQTDKQKALRASANSVYGCTVNSKESKNAEMRVYIKDSPTAKAEILDVEFSNLKTGISEDDQSITERDGVLKISSKTDPKKSVVADVNTQTISIAGSDLLLESCRFKKTE